MSTSRSGRFLLTVLVFAVMLAAAAATPALAHCPGHERAGGCHRHDCGQGYHYRPHACGAVASSLDWYVDYPIYPTPYDTLCNPGSSQYAPRACMAFYEYVW